MVSEFHHLLSRKRPAHPKLASQLIFMTTAYGLSGLLWWAVSGQAWVAAGTLSAQVGGPAVVALLGVLLDRPHWTHPMIEFNPRQVLVWAYFTGAIFTAVALALPRLV